MAKKLSAIAFLVILTFGVLWQGIDKPFIGQHDWNGAFFGGIVRNYLRYGLLTTKFGQVSGINYSTDNSFRYHTNHPSGFHLLLTLSSWIFGLSEKSLRVVPVMFSALAVVYLYLISTYLFNRQVGLLASVLILATPMLRYYGKLPVYEPVVLAIILMGLYHGLLWVDKRRRRDGVLTAFAIIFSGVVDWTGFYFWPLFFLWSFIVNRKVPGAIVFWLVWLATLVLLFGHIWLLAGSPFGGGISRAFWGRIGVGVATGVAPFAWGEFIVQEARWVVVYYTRTVVTLSAVWCLYGAWRWLRGNTSLGTKVLLLLAPLGIIHNVIFHQAAWIHDYLLYYLMPFLTLSAASVVWLAVKRSTPFMLIGLLLVGTVWFERAPFVDALTRSNMSQPGYELGTWLGSTSEPGTRFVVASSEFGGFFGTFASFYADRPLLFLKPSVGEWSDILATFKPRYLIEVKTHNEIDESFRQRYLREEPVATSGPFIQYTVTYPGSS